MIHAALLLFPGLEGFFLDLHVGFRPGGVERRQHTDNDEGQGSNEGGYSSVS
jgi:hypothetical protein